ncbi:MAG: hypothetical protein NC218_11080 [Acetobacter sp.]|nr:hypothetical protein [Acetobacter sp.]
MCFAPVCGLPRYVWLTPRPRNDGLRRGVGDPLTNGVAIRGMTQKSERDDTEKREG